MIMVVVNTHIDDTNSKDGDLEKLKNVYLEKQL